MKDIIIVASEAMELCQDLSLPHLNIQQFQGKFYLTRRKLFTASYIVVDHHAVAVAVKEVNDPIGSGGDPSFCLKHCKRLRASQLSCNNKISVVK